MNQEVRAFLDRAQEEVSAARVLIEAEHFRIAASRAYHAMFYTASGLLAFLGENKFHRHSAVIAAFGREFAKPPAVLDQKCHGWLIEAFSLRQVSDYNIMLADPSLRQQAIKMADRAERFLHAALEWLS